MQENPLSYISTNTHILALYSRGVIVKFDDIVAQPADVNGDGVVNILDLVSVASQFGTQGQNLAADVNRRQGLSIFWIWSSLQACLEMQQPHLQRTHKHLRRLQRQRFDSG